MFGHCYKIDKGQGAGMDLVRLIGLIVRVVAMVLALTLIAISSATIALIRSNQTLIDEVVDADAGDDDEVALLFLVVNTQNAAGWLIFLNIVVIIAEGIAVGLLLATIGETARLVLNILEIIFSYAAMFCYGVTGIACAVYAGNWAAPPRECVTNSDLEGGGCTEKAFTATNSLQTVYSFAQAVMLGVIGSFIIYTIIVRKKQ